MIRARYFKSTFLALATAVPLVLANGVSVAASTAKQMQQDDFYHYCATCHGPMGRGDGPMANLLTKKPADLTVLAKKNGGKFPYVKVRAIIDGRTALGFHGKADMPVWGKRFSDEEGLDDPAVRAKILNLVDYLVSIQEK